jgi:hypothetical protein
MLDLSPISSAVKVLFSRISTQTRRVLSGTPEDGVEEAQELFFVPLFAHDLHKEVIV